MALLGDSPKKKQLQLRAPVIHSFSPRPPVPEGGRELPLFLVTHLTSCPEPMISLRIGLIMGIKERPFKCNV